MQREMREHTKIVASSNTPPGVVVLWLENKAVPIGWVLCDGANGTPDLLNKAPHPLVYIMKILVK